MKPNHKSAKEYACSYAGNVNPYSVGNLSACYLERCEQYDSLRLAAINILNSIASGHGETVANKALLDMIKGEE
jgi:hypothetical protein